MEKVDIELVRGCSQIMLAKNGGGPDPSSPLCHPWSAFPQPPFPLWIKYRFSLISKLARPPRPFATNVSICSTPSPPFVIHGQHWLYPLPPFVSHFQHFPNHNPPTLAADIICEQPLSCNWVICFFWGFLFFSLLFFSSSFFAC